MHQECHFPDAQKKILHFLLEKTWRSFGTVFPCAYFQVTKKIIFLILWSYLKIL